MSAQATRSPADTSGKSRDALPQAPRPSFIWPEILWKKPTTLRQVGVALVPKRLKGARSPERPFVIAPEADSAAPVAHQPP